MTKPYAEVSFPYLRLNSVNTVPIIYINAQQGMERRRMHGLTLPLGVSQDTLLTSTISLGINLLLTKYWIIQKVQIVLLSKTKRWEQIRLPLLTIIWKFVLFVQFQWWENFSLILVLSMFITLTKATSNMFVFPSLFFQPSSYNVHCITFLSLELQWVNKYITNITVYTGQLNSNYKFQWSLSSFMMWDITHSNCYKIIWTVRRIISWTNYPVLPHICIFLTLMCGVVGVIIVK